MNKSIKQIKYLNKRVKKNMSWKYLKRWIWINDALSCIDELLVNNTIDKVTKEYLLRLSVKLDMSQKKFKSNVMPYKAWKILLKPIKKVLRKL